MAAQAKNKEMYKDIATRLKRLRQERNWTQKELSKHIKCNQMQISAYETGNVLPSLELIIRMAKAYETSMDYIIFGERTEPILAVKDRELYDLFRSLEDMPLEDREMIKTVIPAMIQFKQFFQEMGFANTTEKEEKPQLTNDFSMANLASVLRMMKKRKAKR